MPCGSRPLVGSSRISSSGRRNNAPARPSRCRMPNEYPRTGAPADAGQPHLLEDVVDSSLAGPSRLRPGPRRPAGSGSPGRTGARRRPVPRSALRPAAAPADRHAASVGRGHRPRRWSAAPVRAASGRWSSCPSRWHRGIRRRPRRARRGRCHRPPAPAHNASSAPRVVDHRRHGRLGQRREFGRRLVQRIRGHRADEQGGVPAAPATSRMPTGPTATGCPRSSWWPSDPARRPGGGRRRRRTAAERRRAR